MHGGTESKVNWVQLLSCALLCADEYDEYSCARVNQLSDCQQRKTVSPGVS